MARRPSSAAALTAEVLANPSRPTQSYWRELAKTARIRKAAAADAREKDRLWFIAAYADATALYLEAWRLMTRGQFMEAWCRLEDAEHLFARLVDNPFIAELAPWVQRRAERVALWQTTFPYRFFTSPAMIYKRWACSICGKQSTPVDPCGHTPGRVYDGELAHRQILDAVIRELSIVTDPVQKYSVVQVPYRYDVIEYVLRYLEGPFHDWTGEWTHKRHPHALFADCAADGACPCDSGLRYAECCLPTEGVRQPHFQLAIASRSSEATLDERLVPRTPEEQRRSDGVLRATVFKGR